MVESNAVADVAVVAALGPGGSATGGSAAIDAVVFAVVLVSTPGAVRTSILVARAELVGRACD